MKSHGHYWFLAILAVGGLVLSACAGAPTAAPPTEAIPEKPKVLFMTEDPIGINQYFNSGLEGFNKAGAEFEIETRVVECTGDPTNMDENLRAASREEWDLLILMTFGFEDTLAEVAPETPDKVYVCIDCAVEAPNVRNVDFLTQDAAFLLGAVAGLLTETDIVGSVGPVEMPFMRRWTKPFGDGARYINPDVTVLETLWVGSWSDPATAKELALIMAGQGADHINGVAAAGNPGIFEAARERGFYTYSVDINECPIDPDHIVENLIKRVDLAVYNSIRDFLAGEDMGGFMAYGLADGGVDLTVFAYPDEDTRCLLEKHPDVIERVGEIRQKIMDGEIVIPDPLFEE